MKRIGMFLVCTTLCLLCFGSSLAADIAVQIDTVKNLTISLVGKEASDLFEYEIKENSNSNDYFDLSSSGSDRVVIKIVGNTGASLASGLYWYLKYYCDAEISWGVGDSWKHIVLPNPLPIIDQTERHESHMKYRYYLNVCTVSYSMAFWDFERWSREIDWAAMLGYNIILSFTGQEYIWEKTFKQFNLTREDTMQFYAGPAFLAWGRMGNLKLWGGPLDDEWINDQHDLEVKIVEKVRNYGMRNVLPAFSGFVPDGLKQHYPQVSTLKSTAWMGFEDKHTSVLMINPNETLFNDIGRVFLQEEIKEYGNDHLFNCDEFNEMNPPVSDLDYLSNVSHAIYQSMVDVDPEAIWLMQGWLFLNSEYFWTTERVKAYLDAVPNDHMLILDLSSDDRPQYPRLDGYFGKDMVYNILHNFGGRRALYGNIDRMQNTYYETINNKKYSTIGFGLTMEAIENNYIIYEFSSEFPWRDTPVNITEWISNYALRRAGINKKDKNAKKVIDAWLHLYHSSYNSSYPVYDNTFNIISERPSMNREFDYTWTNVTDTVYVLREMNEVANSMEKPLSPHFLYDYIDVARQVIGNYLYDLIKLPFASYNRKDNDNLKPQRDFIIQMLSDLDKMLGTNENYLLGVWTEDAKKWGKGDEDRIRQLVINAKNQVSSWGPRGEIMDYASKHWNGLISDYVLLRWKSLFDGLVQAVEQGKDFDEGEWGNNVWENVEKAFWESDKSFPNQPSGDTLAEIDNIINKYVNYHSDEYEYEVLENKDADKNDLLSKGTVTKDVEQLKILCSLDVNCKGFNSNGYLKTNVDTLKDENNVKLYIKKQKYSPTTSIPTIPPKPTTQQPTTEKPTTQQPTTQQPTTEKPTTQQPTTQQPTTVTPTTVAPTTSIPTTVPPTTEQPIPPTTQGPTTTEDDGSDEPTVEPATTQSPVILVLILTITLAVVLIIAFAAIKICKRKRNNTEKNEANQEALLPK